MTAQLLTEQRNGEHLAQPASIPCPECGGIAPAHASTCTFGKSIEHLPTAKLAPTAPAPAAAQTPAAAPVVELPESPYSWNLHAEAPDGWDEQFTLRSSDSKEFIDRIEGLKKYLSSHGYKPAARNAGRGRMNESASGDSEEAPLCAIHHKPMQKRQSKQGGFFYSCHEKLEDGSWCPYKPAQKG